MSRGMTTRTAGMWGENAACHYLRSKGWTIRDRNWHAPQEYRVGARGGNEIDIIAERDDYIIFVEVKTRDMDSSRGFGSPARAVDAEKKRRLIRAAASYLRTVPSSGFSRYDIIEILTAPDADGHTAAQLHHIEGAFRSNGQLS